MKATLKALGDWMMYQVGPSDQGVDVRIVGIHRTYSMVVEGSPEGPNGPWTKLPIHVALPGGGYDMQSGVFTTQTANESRFFAVDAIHPVKLTHVRFRIQQWFGGPETFIGITAEGTRTNPRAISDTGGNVADALRGKVIAIMPQTVEAGTGYSEEANIGHSYRQLMFAANVTEIGGQNRIVPEEGVIGFALETKGADDVWYTVWETGEDDCPNDTRTDLDVGHFTKPGQFWVSIGVALHINRMFGNIVRVRWHTSARATFSMSLTAKTAQS
jgi:hypothetical protein